LVQKTFYEVCISTSDNHFSDTQFLWKANTHLNIFTLIIISIFVFIVHECLHIVVINKKGDISFTFRGIFFWLNTNAILSKTRFLVFMSLPFIVLSVVPGIMSFYVSGNIKSIILFVSWINSLISASDIINAFLIAIKPNNSVFAEAISQISLN